MATKILFYAPACNWDGLADDRYPIKCMNRQNAWGYCAWTGLRLLTEVESEKALRGGPWWFEAVVVSTPHSVAYHSVLTDNYTGFRCSRDVK